MRSQAPTTDSATDGEAPARALATTGKAARTQAPPLECVTDGVESAPARSTTAEHSPAPARSPATTPVTARLRAPTTDGASVGSNNAATTTAIAVDYPSVWWPGSDAALGGSSRRQTKSMVDGHLRTMVQQPTSDLDAQLLRAGAAKLYRDAFSHGAREGPPGRPSQTEDPSKWGPHQWGTLVGTANLSSSSAAMAMKKWTAAPARTLVLRNGEQVTAALTFIVEPQQGYPDRARLAHVVVLATRSREERHAQPLVDALCSVVRRVGVEVILTLVGNQRDNPRAREFSQYLHFQVGCEIMRILRTKKEKITPQNVHH